ncbi:MAG: hypothetical protein JRJ20_04415 [Deltaproteobacteria bacterium]|nr:hypothetical protein [Deltaproteobacteria bacterium]
MTIRARAIFFFSFLMVIIFGAASANPDDGSTGSVSVQDLADVATHSSFSPSSPVVLANLLFSGYYEIPEISGAEKLPWGHVTATRMYDPVDPCRTEKAELWDAGKVLNAMGPGERNIYFPHIRVTRVMGVTIATGNGITKTFSGTLYHPVVATTVRVSDPREIFHDEHIKDLRGDFGGTGTINRFSGTFNVTFEEPPGMGAPIQCSYAYYTANASMLAFNNSNVSNAHLGLDNTPVSSSGYMHDLNGDGSFDESDGNYLVQWVRGYSDGSSTQKEWLLGAVAYSVPAVVTPPGRPTWYYGTDITETERQGFDSFLAANSERRTVVCVGSRDGMLHAFDAGRFRWGDNAESAVVEKQGYFKWEVLDADSSFNEQWSKLLALYSISPPDFRWQNIGDGEKAPDYGSGAELWAFIAPNLVARLKNNLLKGEDQARVDASPTIADVYCNGQWRTVLLCGEGSGGDAIFCLDITDPERPLFLWEFSDPDLFRSRSSPAVAQVGQIALGGLKRWVAFIVSGEISEATLDPSVYLIDIADGSVLSRVFLHAGIDRNGDGIDDGMRGVPGGRPAVIDSDGNGYVDRIYIGTDKGFMFKMNIPDDLGTPGYTVDQCVINTVFSYEDSLGFLHAVPVDQQFQPICASPTAVVDNDYSQQGDVGYNIRLFFGTSDSPCFDENINTADTSCHFFAYVDNNGKGECNAGSVALDWYKAVPQGHRIFTSASAAAGTVYFGTSASEGVISGEGATGMLFALNMVDGAVIFEQEAGNITSSPLVQDEHLYIRTSIPGGKNLIVLGGGGYNNHVIRSPAAQAAIQAWKELW